MTLVRAMFVLAAITFVGAVSMTAQAPPPAAAPAAKTWSDADLDKLMKDIGATVGALRKSVDGQNAEMAKEQADKMEMLFEDVDDFWSARNVKDAADIADDAAEHADHVEDAIDAKDFAKAGEHLKMLQSTCAGCHMKYRDKGPDGAYRIKP
jgi:Sec-independent protein translocase protein TatA